MMQETTELEHGIQGVTLVNRGLIVLRLYSHGLGSLEDYRIWEYQADRWREKLLEIGITSWMGDINENLLWIADRISKL